MIGGCGDDGDGPTGLSEGEKDRLLQTCLAASQGADAGRCAGMVEFVAEQVDRRGCDALVAARAVQRLLEGSAADAEAVVESCDPSATAPTATAAVAGRNRERLGN